jgi:hypothetical protein
MDREFLFASAYRCNTYTLFFTLALAFISSAVAYIAIIIIIVIVVVVIEYSLPKSTFLGTTFLLTPTRHSSSPLSIK